jgi:hypothetical protein
MSRYTLVTISGVHTQLAKTIKIKGYTIGVIEPLLPTDEEMEGWSERKAKKWIVDNNKRMEGICNFLNKSKL